MVRWISVPGEFPERLYYTVPLPGEYWWDPLTGELTPGGDQQVWQIDIPDRSGRGLPAARHARTSR